MESGPIVSETIMKLLYVDVELVRTLEYEDWT